MRQPGIWLVPGFIALCFTVSLHAEVVWIDADPACGVSRTSDVDDCWALHLATRSPALEIRGISTIFGNSDGAKTYQKTQEIVSRLSSENTALKIYRGADHKLDRRNPQLTEASAALANILTREKMTIIALGPVTNIATLLQTHPGLAGQVNRIIVVAGKRDHHGYGFYPGNTLLLHLHDFNFRKDVEAFDVIMNSKIPVILVPYEVASRVVMLPADLERLKTNASSQWLAETSQQWMDFWQNDLNANGFFPFDSLAIAYVINSEDFECEKLPAKIKRHRSLFVASRDDLLVSHGLTDGRPVHYCHNVHPGFKAALMNMYLE